MTRQQVRRSVDVSWPGERRGRMYEGSKEACPARRPTADASNQHPETSQLCLLPGGGSLLAGSRYGEQSIRIPSWRRMEFLYEAPEMFEFCRGVQGIWVT